MQISVTLTPEEENVFVDFILEHGANDDLLDLFTENVEIDGDNIYLSTDALLRSYIIDIHPTASTFILDRILHRLWKKFPSISKKSKALLKSVSSILFRNSTKSVNTSSCCVVMANQEIYSVSKSIQISRGV